MKPNKSGLDFIKIVSQYFNFLNTSFYFKVATNAYKLNNIRVPYIEYFRRAKKITIYHDIFSYSIEVEMYFKSGNRASLYEVLKVIAPKQSKKVIRQASNKSSLIVSIKEISEIFQKYCAEILSDEFNDTDLFQKIDENRRKYTDQFAFGPLKSEANQAWQNKEYQKAKGIYLSIQDHLDEKEKRRLEYLINKFEC